MIDWAGIHNTKPKAFELLLHWLEYYEDKDKNKAEPIDYLQMRFILGGERELYDFFDKEEMCIEIQITRRKKNPHIFTPYVNDEIQNGDFSNRNDAERVAFINAFGLLEEQLPF